MDERLRQLIIEVLQRGSPKQPQALNRLLSLIPRLPGIRKDRNPEYLDALNQTLMEVERKLDKFPQQFGLNLNAATAAEVRQCFVQWVNRFLKYDILDLYRRQKLPIQVSLDTPIGEQGKGTWQDNLANEGFNVPTIGGLESWIADKQNQKIQRKGLILELYIESDPQGILKGSYPTNNPQCSCQRLTQRFFLSNSGREVTVKEGNKRTTLCKTEKKENWRAFAREHQVNYQTLKSHWKKCRRLLKEILQDIENNLEQYTRDFLGEE